MQRLFPDVPCSMTDALELPEGFGAGFEGLSLCWGAWEGLGRRFSFKACLTADFLRSACPDLHHMVLGWGGWPAQDLKFSTAFYYILSAVAEQQRGVLLDV